MSSGGKSIKVGGKAWMDIGMMDYRNQGELYIPHYSLVYVLCEAYNEELGTLYLVGSPRYHKYPQCRQWVCADCLYSTDEPWIDEVVDGTSGPMVFGLKEEEI